MSGIKSIPVSQLQVGMYITSAKNNWIPSNNLSREGVVRDPKIVRYIQMMGIEEICIDTDKGADIVIHKKPSKTGAQSLANLLSAPCDRPQPKKGFSEELLAARKVQTAGLDFINKTLGNIQLGKPIDIDSAQEVACDIVESLNNNQNALLCLTQLRQKDQYLLEHSFNVSVFMGILAASMNFQGGELDRLVTGALLHDVGKVDIDDAILHKPGKLTAEEWQEMRKHVTYGEKYLNKIPGLASEVLDICAHHHERLDGSGYPRGLRAEEIPIHSRMSSIVDIYDAVTADRVYHHGISPALALRNMLEWSEQDSLDKELLYQFIRCLSIYPQGSFVLLSNQKLGVVQSVHAKLMHKPVVNIVYNLAKKIRVPHFPLDLSASNCAVKIERVVDPKDYGLDLQELLQTMR